jgi:hypothetical protein
MIYTHSDHIQFLKKRAARLINEQLKMKNEE